MSWKMYSQAETIQKNGWQNAFEHLTGSNADVPVKGIQCIVLLMICTGDRDDKYKKWKNGEYDENWEQGPWGSCYEAYAKLLFLF